MYLVILVNCDGTTCHSLPKQLHMLALKAYCHITDRKDSVYQLIPTVPMCNVEIFPTELVPVLTDQNATLSWQKTPRINLLQDSVT